jgi:hypothetical protein
MGMGGAMGMEGNLYDIVLYSNEFIYDNIIFIIIMLNITNIWLALCKSSQVQNRFSNAIQYRFSRMIKHKI